MTVFHKTQPPWFESVKDLKPGAKRRIGDGLMSSFNGRAYHLWDFREKEGEVYEPQMTLAERLAHTKAAREFELSAAKSHTLPPMMHVPRDWPVAARAWLYHAALNNDDIADNNIGWSPDMQRVIIPLDFVDGTTAWLGRDVDTGRLSSPKYLFPEGMRRGGGAFIKAAGHGADRPIVIVEDWLSGYRIAKDTEHDVVVALGTSLDRDALVAVAQRYHKAYTWLDPDHYGQLGARRIKADLQRMGLATTNIVSDHDPKLHTPDQLREYLR